MKNKQMTLNIYLALFALLTCTATALRTAASFTSLNSYGYYSGALAPVSGYLMAIGTLLLFSYAVVYRADKKKKASFEKLPEIKDKKRHNREMESKILKLLIITVILFVLMITSIAMHAKGDGDTIQSIAGVVNNYYYSLMEGGLLSGC